MNRSTRSVLRKLGTDFHLDQEREDRASRDLAETEHRQRQFQEEEEGAEGRPQDRAHDEPGGLAAVPEDQLTESEKRHEQYRRRMSMGGRVTPAAERLPIMTSEERAERDKNRPKWRPTSFEGPIEKLIEKYDRDLEEVQRHLTLGQSMKYDFTEDGQVLDRDGNVIFDGEKLVAPHK